MKNILILLTTLFLVNSYAVSFKDLFTRYMKYETSLGFGQVNIQETNEFNSDLTFTYLDFGAGASLIFNRKYLVSARISLKKFLNLDFEQNGQSGTATVESVYTDIYFSASKLWKGFLLTLGYDNLNYFISAQENVIEPVRVDRASLSAAWRKFKDKKIIPSMKVGVFVPLSDDVSGFDINLAGSYLFSKYFSSTIYAYKAYLEANSNESESTAFGLSANYRF